MTGTFIKINDTSSEVPGTDQAQADSVATRDSNGDCNFRKAVSTTALVSQGGLQIGVAAKTVTYTATESDSVLTADATSGAITINLPLASSSTRRIYTVKKIDTSVNAVTVDASGSETIDGALTQILTQQYESITIQSNGTSWSVIDHHIPRATIAKSATFTVDGSATDYLVTSGSAYVVNLPPPANVIGKVFRFIKVDAAAFGFVLTPPTGTINGASTKTTSSTQYTQTSVISDGTNYLAF